MPDQTTQTAQPVAVSTQRGELAGVFADVVTEERHTDTLTITEHPVERGAAVSDHAYVNPPEVVVTLHYSQATGAKNSNIGDLKTLYQKLLDLQAKREVITFMTGKRLYADMLIKSLQVTTAAATENVLSVTVTLKKVFLVTTQTVTALPEQQAAPQATGSTTDTGTQNPVPVTGKSSLEVMRNKATGDTIIGEMRLLDAAGQRTHVCYTLEKNTSGLPIATGTYIVQLNNSPRFGANSPEILNVPNQRNIRIHGGNTSSDTRGCILVGLEQRGSNTIGNCAAAVAKVQSIIQSTGGSIQITIGNAANEGSVSIFHAFRG